MKLSFLILLILHVSENVVLQIDYKSNVLDAVNREITKLLHIICYEYKAILIFQQKALARTISHV